MGKTHFLFCPQRERQRERARKEKNWAKSDRLRSDLELKGVELMDQRDGKTLWKKV